MVTQSEFQALREEVNRLRTDLRTLALGGAVSMKEIVAQRSADLSRVDKWSVLERRVLDPDQTLVPRGEFDEVRMKLAEVESLTRAVASVAHALSLAIQTAKDADTLASQVFIGLVNVAKEIGLDCRLDERGDLVVTGVAAHAPESLALSQFVHRRRLQRGE
jgi:hypothetical protein